MPLQVASAAALPVPAPVEAVQCEDSAAESAPLVTKRTTAERQREAQASQQARAEEAAAGSSQAEARAVYGERCVVS